MKRVLEKIFAYTRNQKNRDRGDVKVFSKQTAYGIRRADDPATTSKFGDGYITRTSDGKSYTTSRFGSGWITRGSDGQSFTTSKFGDGAITSGRDGQTVTTSRFGSGTISRSSDGATTTTAVSSPSTGRRRWAL